MLYQYRKDYEKITMGLLSLVDNLTSMDLVNQEMQWYDGSESRYLFLYRDDNNNWSGLVGLEQKNLQLVLHQLVCTPSNKEQLTYNKILSELSQRFPESKIVGNLDTRNICQRWEESLRHG